LDFDPKIALTYAALLARPRRVGTGEDVRVAADLEARLCTWGYAVARQPFTFSAAPNAFLTLVVVIAVVLVAIMLLAQQRAATIADVAALTLILLIVSYMPLNRQVQSAALERNGRGLKWGRRYTAANVIARLSLRGAHSERSEAASKIGDEAIPNLGGDCFANCARNDDLPHLYLVAHYDSKSQHMPLVVRMILFMLAIVAGAILAVMTLLDVSSELYIPIGLLVLAAAIPLLFLDVGNNSPGAIDNASGVGLVLHLAEVLAQRTDWQDHLHITLLFPSAEELTLMGSVAYVSAQEKMLREQDQNGGLYVLNFDGVGIDGDLYYVGRSHRPQNDGRISLLARVQAACAELNLPLKRFGFVGALFDHIPFTQRGFDAISLIAVGRASRSVHTPDDAIDKLHVRGFDQAGRVALRVIEKMIV
jgi:hypothetical protein